MAAQSGVELGVVNRSTGIETFEDLKTNEVQAGSTCVGSLTYIIPTLLNELADISDVSPCGTDLRI